MGSDFNSCRFDFRLDVKTGLLPSRRRRGCSTAPDGSTTATTGGRRVSAVDDQTGMGAQCRTLYSCKICGCLLRSRTDRKAHTLQHKQILRLHQRHASQPDSDLVNCLPNQSLVMLGATHPGPLVESSAVEGPSSSELGIADFDVLRSPLRSRHDLTEHLLPSADDVSQESRDIEVTPAMTSSLSVCFRSLDDVIRSRDSDSASGIASMSDATHNHNAREIYLTDPQSNEILDLTTKAAGDSSNPLPVLPSDDARNDDFRSSLVRQRKSRGLDLTVQKLWQFKLRQQQNACAVNDVTLQECERSRSRDNCDDLRSNLESVGRRYDEQANWTRRHMEERPSFETAVNKVTGSMSPGHGEGHAEAELTLRRVVATASPGERPLYYTSLMRLQSTRRKTPTQKRLGREVAEKATTTLAGQQSPQTAGASRGRVIHESHVTQVTCRVCHFEATDAEDLRSHMLATHGHEMEELRATHLCTKCGRRFTSKASLAHHASSSRHHAPHAAMTSLRRHNANLSLRHRRLQLSLQGIDSYRQTVERRSRGSVMTSFTGTGSSIDCAAARVTCEFPGCRREFRERKHLKVHRMQHTDERPLSCALCTYTCRQRNSLNWHMKSRHGLSKSVTEDGRTVYVISS